MQSSIEEFQQKDRALLLSDSRVDMDTLDQLEALVFIKALSVRWVEWVLQYTE